MSGFKNQILLLSLRMVSACCSYATGLGRVDSPASVPPFPLIPTTILPQPIPFLLVGRDGFKIGSGKYTI